MWWFVFIICFVHFGTPQITLTEIEDVSYQIAGIFEHAGLTQRLAFNESMRHNSIEEYQLDPIILQPSRTDSYSVWRELCQDNTIRPIAIVGPQNPITDGAIRDQCARAHIPHLQATWTPFESAETTEQGDEETEENAFKKITINFYPNSDEILQAYAQLLKYYKWENFVVLYEDEFGLMRIQKILAEHSENHQITVRRIRPEGNNQNIFKELVAFQESRFLLDCHVDRIYQHLNEARELKMVDHYQQFIIVSLDASISSEKLASFPSNFTWLSLTEHNMLKDPQHHLSRRVGVWVSEKPNYRTAVTDVQLDAILMDDIANHVLRSVQALAEENRNVEKPTAAICDNTAPAWYYGPLLQEKILKTQSHGVTGNIEFDDTGKRVNYTLHINEKYLSTIQAIGFWDSSVPGEINVTKSISPSQGIKEGSKHFTIISRKAKPYFWDREPCTDEDECDDDSPEAKFEGFSVDLVVALFEFLKNEGYNYTYSFIHTMDYGSYDPKIKKWSGLVGSLLDKKADLAVADLTITEERKKVVDFSVPFMSLGISILYTRDRKVVPGMFSFLKPYTVDVWIYTMTAYCVVSIVLFICSRISPADWENPQPCDKDPEELENIWNFKNCAWLTMGSIMTQGCDILPKAIGTRWVCSMWWFFAVIVCQTYIAQLAASMTSALESESINSIEDLATQNKVLYGAINGGSTLGFFKNSKDKMYRRMYDNMMANDVVLVKSNDEGEKRVLKGKSRYAFFMESSSIKYKLKRNCDLKKVGGELDSKDYGIAMPSNSPFRTEINRAILKLKEMTVLDNITMKWWEQKYGAVECEEETDEDKGDLEMENLIGAFVVLIVGLVFCLFITAAEFMNEVRNIVVREQVSHKEVFIKELKASLNFFELEKPVLRNPSRAPSIASSLDSEEKQKRREAVLGNFMDFEKQVM